MRPVFVIRTQFAFIKQYFPTIVLVAEIRSMFLHQCKYEFFLFFIYPSQQCLAINGNLFKRSHFPQRDKKNVFKGIKTKVIQTNSISIFRTAQLLRVECLVKRLLWTPEVSAVWISSGMWSTRPREGKGSARYRKTFTFNPSSEEMQASKPTFF